MGDGTKIEWTNATWNPMRGCSRISPGCQNCYAERLASRFGGEGLKFHGFAQMRRGKPHWSGKVALIGDRLTEPFRWRRPRRIFVNSMSDLFHEKAETSWIDKIFAVMAIANQHQYQVLTKRADRMKTYLNDPETPKRIALEMFKLMSGCGALSSEEVGNGISMPLQNVWLGVSVENQKYAEERIGLLLETPASVRFLSVEPFIGPVDLEPWLRHEIPVTDDILDAPDGTKLNGMERHGDRWSRFSNLHWVIVGCESGPRARPMKVDWVRTLRDQCVEHRVPFFLKQMKVGRKVVGLPKLDGKRWRQYPKRKLARAIQLAIPYGGRSVAEAKTAGSA